MRHRHAAFRWTVIGAACLALAFGLWWLAVAPVNREIVEAISSAPESVPALWMRLRDRWEYGHAAGFVLQLVGFGALVVSVLVETPGERPRLRIDPRLLSYVDRIREAR